MPTPLTDADKVLRNDTGKDIVEKLDDIAQALGVGVNADQINYDNATSGLEATDVQEAIDEVNSNSSTAIEKIYNYIRFPYISNIDKVPYLFRKSGGSLSVGDWKEDKLVGGSVAFNQLIQNGDFPTGTESSWSATGIYVSFSNGVCSVTMANSGSANNIRQSVFSGREEHVIFATQTITSAKALGARFFIGENYTPTVSVSANTRTVVSAIEKTKSSYSNSQLYFYFNASSTLSQGDTLTIENAFAIDLTQMFGEEVAEYFYNLETDTAGAGVSAFRSLFQNDYYAYNTGEIISVKTSAHKTIGFNQWDEEWEIGGITNQTGEDSEATNSIRSKNYYRFLPNTTYYLKNGGANIHFYDKNYNYLGYRSIMANTEFSYSDIRAYYFRLRLFTAYGTTYNNDVCVNISDTSKNGTYEPYEEHIYPLDSNLELRGSIKLNTTTNTLYNDGDTYDSTGNVIRKYGYIDLGSLSWTMGSSQIGFYANISTAISPIPTGDKNASCAGYTRYNATSTTTGMLDKTFALSDGSLTTQKRLFIRDDSYNGDTTAFTTGVTGKYLVYTLATPTTETATPFTNPQRVFNNGTEEYIDTRTIAMPVGHETKYQYNI